MLRGQVKPSWYLVSRRSSYSSFTIHSISSLKTKFGYAVLRNNSGEKKIFLDAIYFSSRFACNVHFSPWNQVALAAREVPLDPAEETKA